jgi:hypothetical protein
MRITIIIIIYFACACFINASDHRNLVLHCEFFKDFIYTDSEPYYIYKWNFLHLGYHGTIASWTKCIVPSCRAPLAYFCSLHFLYSWMVCCKYLLIWVRQFPYRNNCKYIYIYIFLNCHTSILFSTSMHNNTISFRICVIKMSIF